MRTCLATIAVLLLAAAPAHAARTPNLLQNPGGDAAAPGRTTPSTPTPIPNWVTTGSFSTEGYGPRDAPQAAEVPGAGKNYFAGGESGPAVSTATQDVDVAVHASQIDGGTLTATLDGYLGGFQDQTDDMSATATFLSGDGIELGAKLTIGPVSPGERENKSRVLLRSASGAVPGGTRIVRVVLTATRRGGTYNDGYADAMSLTLDGVPDPPPPPPAAKPTPEPTPPPVFGAGGIISAPSNKQCVSRRLFRVRVRQPKKGLKVEQAIVFVNGKKVATRKGRRVTAPVDLRGLPKGQFKVKITAIMSNGDIIGDTRRYKTCTPRGRG